MSNHTIKAKSKNCDEIVDVTIIEYKFGKYFYFVDSLGEEHLYNEVRFNDLFEVVEDKAKFYVTKCCNAIRIYSIQDNKYSCSNCRKWCNEFVEYVQNKNKVIDKEHPEVKRRLKMLKDFEVVEDTDKPISSNGENGIPQTDTLKNNSVTEES